MVLSIPVAAALVAAATIPAQPDTLAFAVLMQGNRAGTSQVVQDARRVQVDFEYNDRGRGPLLRATYELDDQGRPSSVLIVGNDYLKSAVEERFGVADGRYRWQSQAESGERDASDGGFYLSFNSVPWETAQLAAAAVKASGRLNLLPTGAVAVEAISTRELSSSAGTADVTLYRITGLGFTPTFVWLDDDLRHFATASGWLSVIREGWDGQLDSLVRAQEEAEQAWYRAVAEEVVERPERVVFANVRVFSDGQVQEGRSVLVQNGRIERIAAADALDPPPGSRVVDGRGRTLLPGLFDMHVHVSDIDGLLNIAAGVTTVRDLANDTETLLPRRDAWDAGTLVGPHVVLAGFMDGPGPFAGPTRVLVDTPEEARAAIDEYARTGHVQIKVYSSIRPDLVPAIVEHAHALGLRVSGHIPSGMTARQAVLAGFDEIQHTNMLILNFLGDTLDTRTPVRFTEVGRRAPDLDLDSDSVRDFIQLLADRQIVVDPTLSIFEGLFAGRPGEISPDAAPFADRLPPLVRRGYLGGGLPVTPELDDRYRSTVEVMRGFVRRLYEAGVPLVAGTDALAGFTLHRELENYVAAGIPAPQVLKIATADAARIAGVDGERGHIAPGMEADLVLVDGRPDERIEDIRRTVLVVKDGVLIDPERVWDRIDVRSWRARALP